MALWKTGTDVICPICPAVSTKKRVSDSEQLLPPRGASETCPCCPQPVDNLPRLFANCLPGTC
jgi:hypothetical protein